MASLPPGTVLHGRYVVAREINRGGSAVVYEAADTATGAHVALKVMTAAEGRTALPARAVRREIEYGAALRHCSHVVPLLDAFADGDHLVMVVRQGGGGGGGPPRESSHALAASRSCSRRCPTPHPRPPRPPPSPTHPHARQWQLVRGGDLLDTLNAHKGRFDEPTAAHYFAQLVEGLRAIHAHGLSHRDIKPGEGGCRVGGWGG